MTPLPIRLRLTLWYFLTLAAILLFVATGSWFAMRLSLDHALDRGLAFQLTGMREYIAEGGEATPEAISTRLAQIAGLADLFLVYDAQGNLLCQSAALARRHITRQAPPDLGEAIHFRSGGTPRFPLRMASQRFAFGGSRITLEVAEPVRKYESALTEFSSLLWFSLPVLLALATFGGFWLSSRALRPVDRLIQDAHAITASDLSRRLEVSPARDELRRLSETLNEMLDRIQESFERVRRFTADASHELRGPLTLMQAAAEFSLRRERSREELVASMATILGETKRTSRLIDSLLLLARADADRTGFPLRPIDLAPLIDEVAGQATALAAAREIAVTSIHPAAPLTVDGDEVSLRSLLMILVDNAIRHTTSGGRLALEAVSGLDEILISIADTGTGIAAEDLPHIFERFWRADKVRSRGSGGAGLGLSIASEIARMHRATITVASELGRGSTFTLHLPKK